MTKIVPYILLLFFAQGLQAQKELTDSYTIQRLLITNDKGEILLEKHPNGWMTPALRHQNPHSINQGLYDLAAEFGLQISPPHLSGIFTFLADYKPQSSFRQYFKAELKGGAITIPDGKLEAAWFPKEKALEMMVLPGTKIIQVVHELTEHVLEHPNQVWGRTYSLWKADGKTQYKPTEPFYSLIGCTPVH